MKLSLLHIVFAVAAAGASAAACSPPTVSSPPEYAERPISAEAGEAYFLRTGGGDPYATGMAYPVFLALMEAYPNELGSDWNAFAEKFGFLTDPKASGDPSVPPIGFHLTTDPNTSVPWLVGNCQMCHTERIHLKEGDLLVSGLGNKAARPHAYANALARIGASGSLNVDRLTTLATKRARAYKVPWSETVARPIVSAMVNGLALLAKKRARYIDRFEPALPGRMATIESFAVALNDYRDKPIALAPTTGWAKVPDIRSFPFRETFSYDGSGFGSPQALVLEADFLFGARPEWYLSHPHIATSMYLYLKSFSRKLPFPKTVDRTLVAKGKVTFEQVCSGCHGFYVDHGDEKRVSYRERVIPKNAIGTDPARVDAVTEEFVNASNELPLTRGHARVRNTGGYIPPVLLDVWARGVFGHAGQWPSVEAMATKESNRPRHFIVDTRGFYDLDRLGVRYEESSARPLRPGEYLYDGDKPGYTTGGHTFLADLDDAEKRAVIEYLKTI